MNYDAVNYDAVNYDAVNYDAVNYDAVNYDAMLSFCRATVSTGESERQFHRRHRDPDLSRLRV